MPVPSAGWHAAGTDPSAADWTGGGAGAGFGRSFLHHRVSPGPAAMLSFRRRAQTIVALYFGCAKHPNAEHRTTEGQI